MADQPKILLLDIETLPAKALVWSLWDTNVPLGQLVEPSRVVCRAAKWHHQPKVLFASEWTHSRRDMLVITHSLLSYADAVVTYNGDKFDLPKLNGEFAVEGLGSPGPITSIDLYKVAKRLGFISNKLEFVAPHLQVGEKVKHEGFRLWRGVMEGDAKAQAKMAKYNKQDTKLLGPLYDKLKPFIGNHPYMGGTPRVNCPTCQSANVQSRGKRRTKAFLIDRLQCQDCGSWFDGTRKKVG